MHNAIVYYRPMLWTDVCLYVCRSVSHAGIVGYRAANDKV